MELPWDAEVAATERQRLKKEAEETAALKEKRLAAAAKISAQINTSNLKAFAQ